MYVDVQEKLLLLFALFKTFLMPLQSILTRFVMLNLCQDGARNQDEGSLRKMERLENTIPGMQAGQATQVVASLWMIASISLLI